MELHRVRSNALSIGNATLQLTSAEAPDTRDEGRTTMNHTVVRYTVTSDHASENEVLVKKVYEELHASMPEGLRYSTFVLDDGLTFLHIAGFDSGDGQHALSDTAAFRQFQERIIERCAVPPASSSARQVGSYRFGIE